MRFDAAHVQSGGVGNGGSGDQFAVARPGGWAPRAAPSFYRGKRTVVRYTTSASGAPRSSSGGATQPLTITPATATLISSNPARWIFLNIGALWFRELTELGPRTCSLGS